MLHAATLLHDDVLDNAATRRGQPAAHTLFDVTPTILAGDALLSHANSMVAMAHVIAASVQRRNHGLPVFAFVYSRMVFFICFVWLETSVGCRGCCCRRLFKSVLLYPAV